LSRLLVLTAVGGVEFLDEDIRRWLVCVVENSCGVFFGLLSVWVSDKVLFAGGCLVCGGSCSESKVVFGEDLEGVRFQYLAE